MGRKNLIAAAIACSAAILSSAAMADTKAGVEAWTGGDFAGAIRLWEVEAAKGDADAYFNLGQAYRLGKGVTQDLAKAEKLFGQAAAQGHPQASDNYGLLLFQRGERAKALPYLKAAADRGDPRAQYLLGVSHFNGELVPQHMVRAYALVSLALQQGLVQAAPALAQMDEAIPIEQRQQAAALAIELASQAEATRARQLAAADLGRQLPVGSPASVGVVGTGPRMPSRAPVIMVAENSVETARRVAGSDSPATAGADYARPAAAPLPPAPRPAPAVAIAKPKPAPDLPKPPAPAAASPAAAASGPWRIQLGAFGVAANADAMWAKLRSRPELAGHTRLNVKAGAVTKLQAGGYATQQAAQSACAKLSAAGFTCLAVKG